IRLVPQWFWKIVPGGSRSWRRRRGGGIRRSTSSRSCGKRTPAGNPGRSAPCCGGGGWTPPPRACAARPVARAPFYRWQKPKVEVVRPPRPVPRALPPDERKMVLSMLNDDRVSDLAPAGAYATLLHEGEV